MAGFTDIVVVARIESSTFLPAALTREPFMAAPVVRTVAHQEVVRPALFDWRMVDDDHILATMGPISFDFIIRLAICDGIVKDMRFEGEQAKIVRMYIFPWLPIDEESLIGPGYLPWWMLVDKAALLLLVQAQLRYVHVASFRVGEAWILFYTIYPVFMQ